MLCSSTQAVETGNTVLDAMAGYMLFVGAFLKKMKVNSLQTQQSVHPVIKSFWIPKDLKIVRILQDLRSP